MCLERIEVKVVSGEHMGRTGVVISVREGSGCEVKLNDGVETVTTLAAQDLEAVPPSKNSSIIVLQGQFEGCTGRLIGIDGGDGVVIMDTDQDCLVVDMLSIAVFVDMLSIAVYRPDDFSSAALGET